MVELCERFGTYGLYAVEKSETEFAPELTQRVDAARNHVRTGGRFGRDEPTRTLALRTNYLRESYAYGDINYIEGIESFRTHPSLMERHARCSIDRSSSRPSCTPTCCCRAKSWRFTPMCPSSVARTAR